MKFDPSEYPFGSHPRGATSLHRRSALSGLAVLALSPFGYAQAPTTLPRVGMLCFGSPGNLKSRVDVFLAAMRQVGYVEGRNVRYEMRYGNGQRDLLDGLATELVEKGA